MISPGCVGTDRDVLLDMIIEGAMLCRYLDLTAMLLCHAMIVKDSMA
jgi:hypothetical protein